MTITSAPPRSALRSMCEAFQATAASYPDRVALRPADGADEITWGRYRERAEALAAGFAALGVRPGDTVGLMLANRVEFHLADTGVLLAGATPFSVYNTLAEEQIEHVFTNAGNRVVVCESQFLDRVRAVANREGSRIEHIVCLEGDEGTLAFDDLERSGVGGATDIGAAWRAVGPDDVLTIIYTSGTTGPSKGVELTHAGMLAELAATTAIVPIGPDDSVISYLPDAHIANRWGAHYTSLLTGMTVVPLPDLKQLVGVLPTVRPTFFGAVPQIWYKIKAGIEAELAADQSTVKRKLAGWAIDVGRQRARALSDGTAIPPWLAAQHTIADRVVLSAIRERLGLDRVRFAATGAAAIDPDALEFVLGLGLPVCELWGMSEVTCAATVNPPDAIRIGTVGTALPGVELRIADDGELLVRGATVMKGYRGQPDKTAETIDADGWLATGDIASIDADGYVRIVDRKKELMINAAGKNMSPANIEGTIKVACPLVGSAVAIGDDRPYVVALLTLDPDAVAAFADAQGLTSTDPAALAGDPAVRAAVESGVKDANERLARVEQIKRFTILPEIWEPGGDEITPTMKIKRRPVAAKYSAEISALYAE